MAETNTLSEEQFDELEGIISQGDGVDFMGTGVYYAIRNLIVERDRVREALGDRGYIVFNGPFEVYTDLDDAEDRMRELIHADMKNEPVVISVSLTEESEDGYRIPLGIEMVALSRQAQPGELS